MEYKSKCICGKYAKDYCGNCRVQRYCSEDCQRKDWKKHKIICNKETNLKIDNLNNMNKQKDHMRFKEKGMYLDEHHLNTFSINYLDNEIKSIKNKIILFELKKKRKPEKQDKFQIGIDNLTFMKEQFNACLRRKELFNILTILNNSDGWEEDEKEYHMISEKIKDPYLKSIYLKADNIN